MSEQIELLGKKVEANRANLLDSPTGGDSGSPVLNPASGALVLSRYSAALERVRQGAAPFDAVVASAETDVGRVVLPSADRFIFPSLAGTGSWEPEEGRLVRSRLQPGMTVLNVGAHVGYTTLMMARAVGDAGLVIAIEPEPLNFQLLWQNLRNNNVRNVLPINAAAGDRTGSTTLAYSPDNSGDHRTAPHPLAAALIEVPMVALDDLLPETNLDLVVIDAQGSDHRIVAGLANLIRRCHPPMLVEFWPPGIMELGDDPTETIEFYRSFGYRTSVVTTGDDVSDWEPAAVVELSLDGRDHVTLDLS